MLRVDGLRDAVVGTPAAGALLFGIGPLHNRPNQQLHSGGGIIPPTCGLKLDERRVDIDHK